MPKPWNRESHCLSEGSGEDAEGKGRYCLNVLHLEKLRLALLSPGQLGRGAWRQAFFIFPVCGLVSRVPSTS